MTAKNGLKIIAALITFVAADPAFAGSVEFGPNKKKISLADSFQNDMQCIIKQLELRRHYTIKDVGCFGSRPNNRSAHPTGHACDVDQTARNVTKLNSALSSSDQNDVAEGCGGAVSGCKWRNPDCGHFEQKSAPYSPAGAGIRQHYYSGFPKSVSR